VSAHSRYALFLFPAIRSKDMKKYFLFLILACLFSSANSQIINRITQPSIAVRCSTSQFNNSDSVDTTYLRGISTVPGYSAGAWINCKGISISPGVDSAIVFINPLWSPSAVRYPLKLYGGQEKGWMFRKIWKIGTTAPLDSIWFLPDVN
jgi:hypothetical protein